MKLIKFFVISCILTAAVSVIFNSCKKDQKPEDPINNAKNWYLNDNLNGSTSLQSSKGTSQQIRQEIDWVSAKAFKLDDGTDVVAVPVKMTLGEATLGGSYMLLIDKIKNNFSVKVAYNIHPDFFKTHVTDIDLSAAYKQTLNTNLKNLQHAANKGKVMTVACTNWYMVTSYYDGNGNFTGSSSRYLYTTCSGDLGDYPEPDHGGPIDCAGVLAGGAYMTNCGCVGGTTGIINCIERDIITRDTSITNSPKINCLLKKLLGLDGTAGNAEIKNLLKAFTDKGFDVTFKIGTTQTNSKGETSADPYDPTKYNIVLNRTKINTESQMSWVKTLLHEAFHANLMQKSYELFGSPEIALWLKKPEDMTLEELIDKMENVIQAKPQLADLHHNFMAENIDVIKNGLKSFSLANNSTSIHNSFTDDHFYGLAYEGLNGTSYYLNKVLKDANGDDKMSTYKGHIVTLTQAYYYKSIDFQTESSITCN